MNKQVIRWGIIGAGKIARQFAKDLSTLSNTELYGIASRSLNRAEHFCTEFNAKVAYGSYKELVTDSNIDAIYVATPHSFHHPHALLCLEQNIPVLCEKPFAMNLQEVEEMIHLAKKNKTLLMEAMWTAFLPHFNFVEDLIRSKQFGEVLKLEADFGFFPVYDESSRVFDKSVGGGSLLDIGIYPIFAALSTLGVPESIEAKANYFPNGADSNCEMVFHYKNTKAYLSSTLKEETKTEAIFYCKNGTIKINSRFHEPTTVSIVDNYKNEITKTFDYQNFGFSYEINHFNQLIRRKKLQSDIMTFERSRDLISTLDRVRQLIRLEYN